jgi:hypothetical protein
MKPAKNRGSRGEIPFKLFERFSYLSCPSIVISLLQLKAHNHHSNPILMECVQKVTFLLPGKGP